MAKVRKERFDASDMFAGLDRLDEAKESIARSMGAAMGESVRDEAKARVPVGTAIDGSKFPGLLRSAIYVAYDNRRNVLNPDVYRYVVSWNAKKAPHGHLLEFGHWMVYEYDTDGLGNFWTIKPLRKLPVRKWIPAHPFIGPAFSAMQPKLMSIGAEAGALAFQRNMK